MSRVLENLQPKRVFYYFEEICNIPHTSHNTKAISDYCEKFAKEHNLSYHRDELGNLIINKPAAKGYEAVPAVIIQGHLDMVGAKKPDSDHNFMTDAIECYIDGDWIKAKDTTLGADDGVAVAFALAILEDETLKHPRLQIVLTVDEEVGLDGAYGINAELLDAEYMINLDSDDEGVFLTGSAGGVSLDITTEVSMTECEGTKLLITIDNLIGGHSGVEIGTGRPSANILMGRLLNTLEAEVIYNIALISGGEVDNAICRKCVAEIVTAQDKLELVKDISERVMNDLREEYRGIDDNITIDVSVMGNGKYRVAEDFSGERMVSYLRILPYGVMARNADNVNLVELSVNYGIVRFENDEFYMCSSIRSSSESAKKDMCDKLQYIVSLLDGTTNVTGAYPAWSYNPDSRLRHKISKVYEEMYKIKPEFTTIHAGLECGIFADKLTGLDIVSYGPESQDIHTYHERLSIESARKAYEFTVKLLESITE